MASIRIIDRASSLLLGDLVGSVSDSGSSDYIVLELIGAWPDLTVSCLDICPVPVSHIAHLKADAIEELVKALLAASNLGWDTPSGWRDFDRSTSWIVCMLPCTIFVACQRCDIRVSFPEHFACDKHLFSYRFGVDFIWFGVHKLL